MSIQEKLSYIMPVLFIIVAITEAICDAKKIAPEHALSSIFRALGAIMISFALHLYLLHQVLYVIILLGLYWMVFDVVFNIARGVSPWYIGQTAFLDKLARKILGQDGRVYLALKGVIVFISFCIYTSF